MGKSAKAAWLKKDGGTVKHHMQQAMRVLVLSAGIIGGVSLGHAAALDADAALPVLTSAAELVAYRGAADRITLAATDPGHASLTGVYVRSADKGLMAIDHQVVFPAHGGGYWIKHSRGEVRIEEFGAKGDGRFLFAPERTATVDLSIPGLEPGRSVTINDVRLAAAVAEAERILPLAEVMVADVPEQPFLALARCVIRDHVDAVDANEADRVPSGTSTMYGNGPVDWQVENLVVGPGWFGQRSVNAIFGIPDYIIFRNSTIRNMALFGFNAPVEGVQLIDCDASFVAGHSVRTVFKGGVARGAGRAAVTVEDAVIDGVMTVRNRLDMARNVRGGRIKLPQAGEGNHAYIDHNGINPNTGVPDARFDGKTNLIPDFAGETFDFDVRHRE